VLLQAGEAWFGGPTGRGRERGRARIPSAAASGGALPGLECATYASRRETGSRKAAICEETLFLEANPMAASRCFNSRRLRLRGTCGSRRTAGPALKSRRAPHRRSPARDATLALGLVAEPDVCRLGFTKSSFANSCVPGFGSGSSARGRSSAGASSSRPARCRSGGRLALQQVEGERATRLRLANRPSRNRRSTEGCGPLPS
jgi:hypothetical protein